MPNPELNELSDRELDILKLVATGAGNKEIAQKLYISSNTVKVHLRNIFAKIGVASRTEAAMYAVRTGLVDSTPTTYILDQETEIQPITTPESVLEVPLVPPIDAVPQQNERRLPRWAFLFIIAGLIGLIILGLRLSPSLALLSTSTVSPPPPMSTPTPIPHWRYLGALPTARSNSAIVAYDNQIYSIGGITTQGVYGGLDLFDPQTNTWTTLTDKPLPVFDARAAVINGLIYVPGGYPDLNDLQPTNILDIYETSTGQWHSGAQLPIPLSGYGLVAFEGQLFIFGGWDGTKYRDSVFSYDPTTDAWQEHTSMPTARAYPGAAEASGKMYVIGGIYNDLPVNANEIYTPSHDHNDANPWETGFPIPENRMGNQTVTIADTIYVFGGDPDRSNRYGLIYFPQTDVWRSLEPSPDPIGDYFGMTSIGTNLFFVGGKFNSAFSDQNITYQAIITLSIPIIIK